MKIGIDIGGSHIAVGLVNEDGKVIVKKEKDLLKEHKENIEKTIIDTIEKYIDEIMKEKNINEQSIKLIGIAYPASLRKGKIGSSVNLDTMGFEIKAAIEEKYSTIPVHIRNDAKCAAICEKKYGVLKKYTNAIFLTIGTGIGGGVFINHSLLKSPENDLFKVGHMIIGKDGPKCKCGRRGCFENYASIRALKNEVIKTFNIDKEITGLELHKFMIENYEDERMQKVIDLYIENLSIGISNLINLFEPEAIGIGGSFAYYEDILLEKLEKKLKENVIKLNDASPKILIAEKKNDAGIIGAIIDL